MIRMINSSKSKLTLLVLMSIMLNLALAGYIPFVTPGATPCVVGTDENCFLLYDDVNTASADSRVIEPANQVRDCFRYKTDG
jgi:hypothetical protein